MSIFSATTRPSIYLVRSVLSRTVVNTPSRLVCSTTSLRHGQRNAVSTRSIHDASASADEIKHFDSLAATWWDRSGTSGLLHKMNPARLSFIKSHVAPVVFPSDEGCAVWLDGKAILDVGCGGGILSESLARVGACVTGIDASEAGIMVARTHAARMGLEVEYRHESAESLLLRKSGQYDVVCAMEIMEHVASPPTFLKTVLGLVRPGGWLFVSTIEKSRFAAFLTCTMAEDVLGLVPKGTHNADKFVPKQAMMQWTTALGAEVVDTRGIIYDPFVGTWRVLSKNQPWGEACNYIMAIRKH